MKFDYKMNECKIRYWVAFCLILPLFIIFITGDCICINNYKLQHPHSHHRIDTPTTEKGYIYLHQK